MTETGLLAAQVRPSPYLPSTSPAACPRNIGNANAGHGIPIAHSLHFGSAAAPSEGSIKSPVAAAPAIAHSPIAISPITMPTHARRFGTVKRRRSAPVNCPQTTSTMRTADNGHLSTSPVTTSALRSARTAEQASSPPINKLAVGPDSPAPRKSSRKELSMIWFLLQHLCWKYSLSQTVLSTAQKILIEQYRQQKRARNLALAACCCVIYACERERVAAPGLQDAIDHCTVTMDALYRRTVEVGAAQQPSSCPALDAVAAAANSTGGSVSFPTTFPCLSSEDQLALRRRVSERRSIITAMVEKANRKLANLMDSGDAIEFCSSDEEDEEDEDDLGMGGMPVPGAPCADCDDLLGSSPDSTIALSGISCSPLQTDQGSHLREFGLDRQGMRIQARCKRPCRGKNVRHVEFAETPHEEVEFEEYQSVQGFALDLSTSSLSPTAPAHDTASASAAESKECDAVLPSEWTRSRSRCRADAVSE